MMSRVEGDVSPIEPNIPVEFVFGDITATSMLLATAFYLWYSLAKHIHVHLCE